MNDESAMDGPFSPAHAAADDGPSAVSRFRIVSRRPPYEPAERPAPSWVTASREQPEESSGGRYVLYVLGEAARSLHQQIDWGRRTVDNRCEQGGLLLGHVYRDSRHDLLYGVVGEVLPALGARCSAAHLELTPDTWAAMLARAERRLGSGSDQLQVIGWYHTHPIDLSIFMSRVDRDSQERFFNLDWHFALVLNPHRQVAGAFHGPQAIPCAVTIDGRRPLPAGFFARDAAVAAPALPASGPGSAGDEVPRLGDGAPTTIVLQLGFRHRLNGWWRRLTGRRQAFSSQYPLELTVSGEDRETGVVRIRLEGWVASSAVERLIGDWVRR